MKNSKFKKIALPFLLIVFAIVLGYLYFYQINRILNIPKNHNEIVSSLPETKNTDTELVKDIREKEKFVNNYISVFVLDKNYKTELEEGDTVFDVMQKLKMKDNSFDFKYKEYPSLGVFVNEINGLSDGSGKYWIYSINGKEAEVGISKYILNVGDIISWNQK